ATPGSTALSASSDPATPGGGGGTDPGDPGTPSGGGTDPGDPGNPGGGDGTDPGDTGTPGDPGTPGGGTNPTLTVRDVGIRYKGTNIYLGYASRPDIMQGSIAAKGGQLQFESHIWWSDFNSSDVNHYYVQWSVSDTSLATIAPDGTLTAVADGRVRVRAKVDAAYSSTGADLVAAAWIDIIGQDGARYVTSIRVADAQGFDLFGGPYIWQPDLATDTLQFHALVEVFDPATGISETYNTKDGRLSVQAPDLADIYWDVDDVALASVLSDTGLFRPSRFGIVNVRANSNAGLGNRRVAGVCSVRSETDEDVIDGYHPQESLTIKAYYELYTPADHGEEAYCVNVSFSPAELEAMGASTATYTALGGPKGYFTMTGYGPSFQKVLANAGISDLQAIKSFSFGTADSYAGRPSREFIFGSTRYYFPNIDLGLYTGAVPVQPMIALISNNRAGGDTAPNYAMNEGTRFRLLFGAIAGQKDSSYAVKWINTITVVLKGSKPVDLTGNNGDGSGDEGEGGGGSGFGIGAGAGSGSGTEGQAGPMTEQGGSAGGGQGQGQEKSDGFSVYQIMNSHDIDGTFSFKDENPLATAALPTAATALCLGGAQFFLWYRRQVRPHAAANIRPASANSS
ncbi:MAG: Ig-like domain-containing protein, partial [Coriobacteriaceae bacterium]|nr:Ig-like domain-containing protein [Coriobacteriaceae bacterium]